MGALIMFMSLPLATMPNDQCTGSYSLPASLYNILRKDVEQDTLSQASMPLATMPKALVFTAFLPLCTTYCAGMWSKTCCRKHPCLWRPCPKHWYSQRFASLYNILCKEWNKSHCHKRIKLWPASAGSVRPDKVPFGVCTKTLPSPGV